MALSLADKGYAVGLLDADIYGPSQPVLLKASSEEIDVKDNKLLIPLNKKGIKFVSMGLIARGQKPVIWRGPMVSGAVMQLMSQTDWQELDYLIIDTPPGTGDVQLTLLQRLPLNGALVVTTPQEVSTSDTRKGIEMIKRLELPILGLIENMSFFQPIDSMKKYFIFGKGGGQNLAKEYGLELLSEIPLLEKKEFVILYELSNYKLVFDSIAKKVIKNMEIIKKSVSPNYPSKKSMKKLFPLLITLVFNPFLIAENDPFEEINRTTLKVNKKLDKVIATPVAKLYQKITPDFIEIGIYNSISNVDDINISLNNILQGKIKDGLSDMARFTVNSTLGLAGFIDVASKMGLKKHDEDFGQTLAVWGVPRGPYIMLPGLGPSSLREMVGMIPDAFLSPSIVIEHEPTVYSLKFLDLIDTRARYLGLESIVIGDEYLFIKDAYYQNRDYDIKDGEVKDDFDSFDDF